MTEKKFTLKCLFDRIGEIGPHQTDYSANEEHCGVEWNIVMNHEKDHLGVYINAELPEGKEIEVDYTIKIVSKNKEKKCSMSTSCVLTHDEIFYGCPSFIDWKTLKNEYVLDNDKLEVVIHVKITKMVGFPEEIARKDLRSFCEDMKQFSDVVLKVEDRKFHVLKLYLSSHSPYFSTLFLGNFQESQKSEIELKDVDPRDFQCYLEVLHLENAIDDDTVQGILSVANMFDTPVIVKKCEEFLVEKSKKGLKRKLELAGNYRMEGLKKTCLDQILVFQKLCLDLIKTKKDIRSVMPDDPREMDKDILAELLKKSLDSK